MTTAPTTFGDFWAGVADMLERPEATPGGDVPGDWRGWLQQMFPRSFRKPFGAHHEDFWSWVWELQPEVRPEPGIFIWARGGGKSTGGEAAVAALGARGIRRYCVYLSSTQDQADKRVENIGTLLESESVLAHYPALGRREMGKYGRPKAWRRNRLRTASGFTVDALGLDTAARGLKVDDQRPDLIVLDDIDHRHDGPRKTRKKIETITDTILPMGTGDLAVLGLQNLIIPDGIFAQLADGRAEFLVDRRVFGPVPAVVGLKTEPETMPDGRVRSVIVAGEPTWQGQSIADCQALIDTSGLPSFLREQQHEVGEVEGALWTRDMIRRTSEVPDLVRVVVGVDPSGGRAEIGIVVVGLGRNGFLYVLADRTQPGRLGTLNWGRTTVAAYERWHADKIVAEKNFGGDMVKSTIRVAAGSRVPVDMVNASRGKMPRAEPIASVYGEGRVYHVGTFPEMETEMTRWVPEAGEDSPNRMDALVWACTEILFPAPRVQHYAGHSPR